MTRPEGEWVLFDEALDTGIQLGLAVEKILYREQTEHQDLVIYQTAKFGRVMALDGILQVCERDEFIYHEMLTHVPLFAHGNARDVCIVGGGDGGMLREVLRHEVRQVTMVEIDQYVIDLCTEYLPSISNGAFNDPRANIVIEDGAAFMKNGTGTYDVIIVDSTDPIGPGEVLFTVEFYADCKKRLNPGGVLVTQSGVVLIQGEELTNTVQRQGQCFADASAYVATIPTYIGGCMAFGWASDDTGLRQIPLSELQARYDTSGIETRYYNPQAHKGAFALPGYVQECVDAAR